MGIAVAMAALAGAGMMPSGGRVSVGIDPGHDDRSERRALRKVIEHERWRSGAAFMGPAELQMRGRQRRRARQTHPGKRGGR